MGNEQSRGEGGAAAPGETAEGSEAEVPGGPEDPAEDALGRDSPRPSICSDADLPYISYTVNRPIGGKSRLLR